MNLIKKYLDANPGVPKLSLPELFKKLGEAVATIKAEEPDVPEAVIRMSLVEEIQERQGVTKPGREKWHAPLADGKQHAVSVVRSGKKTTVKIDGKDVPVGAMQHAAKLGLIG